MKRWTEESAILEATRLIGDIEKLRFEERFSAEHTRWLTRSLGFFEEVFGPSSILYATLHALPWHQTGSMIVPGFDPESAIERRHHDAYVRQLDTAKGLLQAAIEELETRTLDEVYKGKDSPQESSTLIKVLNLVDRKLRKILREPPTIESTVQEALENLLIASDIPYRREADSIPYSSKTYRPDFTMERIDLAVDVKLCARSGREKEIIAEINDDILAYKTRFGNVLFVVYDVGMIRDVDTFRHQFEEIDDVLVRVVKH